MTFGTGKFLFWPGICLAGLLLPPAGFARAAGTDLTAPLGNAVLLKPQLAAHGAPQFYGASGKAPRWNIAQWGIPGEHRPNGGLPPFRTWTWNGVTVQTSAGDGTLVRLVHGSDGTTAQLGQNGAYLACRNPSGEPREADLFIQTNDGTANGARRPGFLSSGTTAIPLGKMTHLYQSVTLSLTASLAARPKPCAVNQSGALTAFVLQDRAAHPTQTLFYQFSFSNQCGPGTPARVRLCEAKRPAPSWFFDKNPFGVDDSIPLIGRPLLRSGETRSYHLDLLPRLLQVIAHGPHGLDRDPGHWVITGVYIGQHIWGGVVLHSTWSDYRLVAETRNGQ